LRIKGNFPFIQVQLGLTVYLLALSRLLNDFGGLNERDIVKLVYSFAILRGEKVSNPADEAGPSSIATFVPKDRSLSPAEIRVT
jgi:hypothetical protein